MSMGSWTLTAFSGTSAAAAMIDLAPRRIAEADLARLARTGLTTLSAALGALMATYTGVLIGATAVPAWNENVDLLPAHFAASGVGAAVALLTLAGHDEPGLNQLALGAATVETLVGAAIETRGAAASAPLRKGVSGAIVRTGGVLSGPVPLLLRAASRRRGRLRTLATVAAIAGSILTRFGWIAAGRASASRSRPAGTPAI
jgi:formate-dependent nitrite reductase membrane component NrfD